MRLLNISHVYLTRVVSLYKYLLLTLCNDMNQYLPDMFTSIKDYKTLLFPDNLLKDDSVLAKLITDIDEDSWTDQVQIIGWLYQYYNSELKDFVMKKKNYTKDDIPAATQLFTPDWIVRYMTENSLGRLWVDGHPNFDHSDWKYYLEEAEQEPEVIEQLNKIKEEHAKLKPEDIKVIDPCMGSGHILVYAFDVLMDIYSDAGYSDRDAAKSILENNLYGLEIDERAYHLAYFALMMKARSYNRRILNKETKFNLVEIREPIGSLKPDFEQYLDTYNDLAHYLVNVFQDAKEFGSILSLDCTVEQLDNLKNHLDELKEDSINKDLVAQSEISELNDLLKPLIKQAKLLVQKYDVVITNPPYMGSSGMSIKLSDYVKRDYPDSKSDLFAVFIERCGQMTKKNGYQAMITQHAWMFLASYENMRKKISKKAIINMAHLGARAFEEIGGEIVQTTSFVIGNTFLNNYLGTYCRLVDPTTQTGKEELFIKGKERYISNQLRFQKIPGEPIAYWISDQFANCYDNELLEKVAFSDGQILTGNNDKYLKLLWEVNAHDIESKKWALHAKGGEFRRWYGNIDTVVKFDPITIQHYKRDKIARFPKDEILFRRGITWTLVSMNPLFGVRELGENLTFNKAAATILFNDETIIDYVLGFLNSKVSQALLRIINPTMNNNIKDILNMPFIKDMNFYSQVKSLVQYNIIISKQDWDSFETSWTFKVHPLVKNHVSTISEAFSLWNSECESRFNTLKSNEEELNRIFIDIYGLQDELDPYEEDKDVTVRKADLVRDIKSFISYAVGCMFGRYSLDVEGLAYAGGDWDSSKYSTFIPDTDDIIPICDEEYFEDDIVTRFIEFVRVVYGSDTLEDNLSFIANALGGKGNPRDVLRNYFLNDFFKDHCNTYQVTGSGKRPIYWLFDSGKKNGFKALVYIHRYAPDLIARLRTGYVHPQQARYRTQVELLQSQVDDASSTSERVKLSKQLKKINEQLQELNKYEEVVHHWADKMEPMDLDDGVKVNYVKFQELLSKIK